RCLNEGFPAIALRWRVEEGLAGHSRHGGDRSRGPVGAPGVGACKAARVADLHVHDLRRFAARNLIRSGVSEQVAMTLLGHSTSAMFRRYRTLDDSDLRAGGAAASQGPAGLPTSSTARELVTLG